MSKLLKSSGAVAIATMLSRVLGFLRESAYSGFFGDTPVASAFILAFTIPNLLRRLLGEGALTAVFVPIFTQKEREEGQEATWRGAAAVISALLVVCTVFTVIAFLVATFLIQFTPFRYSHGLMLGLLRWMLPFATFICTAAVFVGMLNARGRYFMPALGAAVMNIVMIASVYFLTPWFGSELEDQVYGLALGVIIGGAAQAGFQIPSILAEGFRFRWVTPWSDPMVRETAKRMLPATLGVAAYQFNVVATAFIANSHASFAVASFNYAVRLLELPQGVIGVSLSTYLLTELSRLSADKKFPEFRSTLRDGLLHLIFINTLATVLLMALAEPIIRLLFQHGRFNELATQRASLALLFLAPGLVATSLNSILSRAFYALADTKTPMHIGLFCLASNLVLVLVLVGPFLQVGLAAANAISALLNCALLVYAFRRKMPKFDMKELIPHVSRIAGLGLLACALGWAGSQAWESWVGHAGKLRQIGAVFVPASLAGIAYVSLGLALRMGPALEIRSALLRRFQPKTKP
jgi:putative peptidoglycan lipid II flippase